MLINLDTNVVVRWLLWDDPKQSPGLQQLFDSFTPTEPGYITTVVLAEVVWVLRTRYGQTREELAGVVQTMLKADVLRIEREDAVAEAVGLFRSSKAGFTDCLVASLGAAAGCEHTATFDRVASRLPSMRALYSVLQLSRDRAALEGRGVMQQECEVKLMARGPKGAWTHIVVPFDAAEAFGRKGLIPVAGTVNGYTFRSSLMPEAGGTHYLAVNKEMLAGAKAAAGDVVRLVLALDAEERTVSVPEELMAALAGDAVAAALFEGLAYSHRKEYADWVASGKKAETRVARGQKAVEMLREGKRGR